MTIDTYYSLVKKFLETASKYTFLQQANQLRNTLSILKSARNNASAQVQQHVVNARNQIEVQKTNILTNLRNFKNDLVNELGYYDYNQSGFDELLNDEAYNKIANLSNYINSNNYAATDSVEDILNKAQNNQ